MTDLIGTGLMAVTFLAAIVWQHLQQRRVLEKYHEDLKRLGLVLLDEDLKHALSRGSEADRLRRVNEALAAELERVRGELAEKARDPDEELEKVRRGVYR